MTTAAWPVSVTQNCVRGSYREAPDENVARFQPEVGPSKMRRRMSISSKQIQFESVLSLAECATLDTFWRTTLKDGTLPFTRKNPRNGATETYIFAGPYQRIDLAGGYDRVAFSLHQIPS